MCQGCYLFLAELDIKRCEKTDELTTSQLSTNSIELIVEELRNEQHRDSTKRNYYTVWKLFNKFFLRLDYKPDTWEKRIILFLGYLIQTRKQSSMVKSYLSAIRAVLKSVNVNLNEDIYLISSLTKACRLKNDRVRHRLPIQKGLLKLILARLREEFNDSNLPYLATLYQTLFITAYFGLFRVGELTKGSHPVLAADVHIGQNKQKFLFVLRSSKTHTKGNKPQMVKISSTRSLAHQGDTSHTSKSSRMKSSKPKETELPCPYRLLRMYTAMRGSYGNQNEPFFVFKDKSPVTLQHMRSCLKLTLTQPGFDAKLYGTHSLRVGRSVDLLKLGLLVETIKKLGCWRSNAVFHYLR